MTKSFKTGDLLAIGMVLLLAAVSFLAFLPRQGHGTAVAQIYQDGQLLMTVPLEQSRQFPVRGKYCNTVSVKDGAIAIIDSDCPGQDCVHSGSIRAPGRSLVCLPNALEIRVVSGQSDVDFVVG